LGVGCEEDHALATVDLGVVVEGNDLSSLGCGDDERSVRLRLLVGSAARYLRQHEKQDATHGGRVLPFATNAQAGEGRRLGPTSAPPEF
jgi:hypothetical protein